jgi:hypothetical protein
MPLVVRTENGPGRSRCNWIGRVMVPLLLPTPPYGNRDAEAPWLPLTFYGGGCLMGAKRRVEICDPYLALILVVKFLGGGGTPSGLW